MTGNGQGFVHVFSPTVFLSGNIEMTLKIMFFLNSMVFPSVSCYFLYFICHVIANHEISMLNFPFLLSVLLQQCFWHFYKGPIVSTKQIPTMRIMTHVRLSCALAHGDREPQGVCGTKPADLLRTHHPPPLRHLLFLVTRRLWGKLMTVPTRCDISMHTHKQKYRGTQKHEEHKSRWADTVHM